MYHETLKIDTTQKGNLANTNPQTLFSFSIPPGTLVRNGQSLRIKIFGTNAANANSKTMTFNFGATQLVTFFSASGTQRSWNLETTIIRTGPSSQLCSTLAADQTDNNYGPKSVTSSEDTSGVGTPAFSFVATDGNGVANDIVYQGCVIELLQDNNPPINVG